MNSNTITIINQDSGYLMIDIANAFVEKGFDVNIVAGRVVERNIQLDKSVKWIKIIRYKRESTFSRLYTWIIGTIQILFLIWFKFPKSRLLIVSNPPLAPLLAVFCKNKIDILIYDVYPDALYEMDIISSQNVIVKIWRYFTIKAFRKAERIITITDGMKTVLEKYAFNKSIDVIPLWSDSNFLKPIQKHENIFLKTYNLTDKFVVLYSGNIGISSNVDSIVDLAKNSFNPDIIFLIIGEGARKSQIINRIASDNITNCLVLPWQDASMLRYSLAAADISIVTSTQKGTSLSIPSKLFSILAVGSPVLCFSTNDSELEKIVKKYDFGKSFLPDSLDEAIQFIESVKNNSGFAKKLSDNALAAGKLFSPENAKRFVS
jgi:hypothetical protein